MGNEKARLYKQCGIGTSERQTTSFKGAGDFGCIARLGNTHLALASIALISPCALGNIRSD